MFHLARLYIFLYHHLLRRPFGLPIKGMGIVQRWIKSDRVLTFKGKKLYYGAKVKGSYDMLLIGKSNEPETHLFFEKIIPTYKGKVNFIDVGASIGEMLLGVSIYDNVEHIYGFEPRKDCAEVIRKLIK